MKKKLREEQLQEVVSLQEDNNGRLNCMTDSINDIVYYLIKSKGYLAPEDVKPIDGFLYNLGFIKESLERLKEPEK
ncbi:MAG: hypothetical protein N4A71_02430 [Carboxylicivirga sp.]|jgi:predicted HAD superfamily phosphohydrolase|nr:hypothetical protein [Carboxylicivirga sp.]